jgi:hypothetical protein
MAKVSVATRHLTTEREKSSSTHSCREDEEQ